MKNYETPGMEFLHKYSIPEDRALLFRSDGTTITKVWDTSGHAFEIPTAKDLNLIGYFPAYRTGEYNSGGDEGFELHEENSTKTSWWTPTTGSLVFVKITSASSRLAAQVNIETGAIIGEAKAYTVIGNGSFHGTPEAVLGDIHFAVDLVTQWAIIICGYGTTARTISSLFTYKDVDMRLSLDLDCQYNLVDARLAYAGIWYGVHKLWYPGVEENPIQTEKSWYSPELIGVNATRAIFIYIARQSTAYYMGLQSFDYTSKTWIPINAPTIAGGSPVAGGAVQVTFIYEPKNMLTVTSNNKVFVMWQQYQRYDSGGWKIYYKYVVRELTSTGWDTAYVCREGSQSGLYPSYNYLGAHFNNNGFGAAYYFNSSLDLVVRTLSAGTWSSETTITTTPDTPEYGPVSFIKTESNYDRAYILYNNDSTTAYALHCTIYSGGSWSSSQIDDASGNKYDKTQMCVVDDAEKALVVWAQGPAWYSRAWYSRFYSSAGWGSAEIHERTSGERYVFKNQGCAYNGTVAVVAGLGEEYGTGDLGLFVDRWNGSAWDGVVFLESMASVFPPGTLNEFDVPCHIDSSGNIYVGYYMIDSTTPANSFVKVAYYNASTSTWSTTKLNTASNYNMYMSGSGDKVLVCWCQEQQLYACIGESGTFTSPKRISYYNPSNDYSYAYQPAEPANYIPPMIASYGGQYLAMMCYSKNRNFPADYYGSVYGEKEAVIANTGYYS